MDLFSNAKTHGGWPQWNDVKEKELRIALVKLQELTPHDARARLEELGKQHGERRNLVWAELGDAPLACAMESLGFLAELTSEPLTAGETDDLSTAYCDSGWRADDAVLRALACVTKQEDVDAVTDAVRSVYMSWVEDAARYLQKVVTNDSYPESPVSTSTSAGERTGECILFVDGLRIDAAHRLVEMLNVKGLTVGEEPVWAAIPSVTATGKPAVAPVRHLITGQEANTDFEPCVIATGQSLKGGRPLKKLLTDEEWQLLNRSEDGDPQGAAWCEFGNIDHEGHDRGWKLAKHLDSMLGDIAAKIEQLLMAGWKTVRVVTDHGWLLMPGELPKTELPSSLRESAWGRCAVIKPGAHTEERLFPWFWNQHQEFALADGISCYRAGYEYAHGGVSLQECLTLHLTVSEGVKSATGAAIEITDVAWKGLRCKVAVDGETAGLFLDLRTHPGNAATSVAMGAKPFKEDGTSSVVVEDEDMEGEEATIVLIDDEGRLVAQRETVIGKENN